MEISSIARLYTSNTIWRTTGSRSAGRSLVRCLDSNDETVRVLAGMFLVRGNRQAIPLLLEALTKHQQVPIVLQILADIGDQQVEPLIAQYSTDSDPEVARAAQDALNTLRIQRKISNSVHGQSGLPRP